MSRTFAAGLCVVALLVVAAPVLAQPAAPILVSPSGLVDSASQTFTWRASPGATWYHLWIDDAGSSPQFAEWYTAAQAGCADGTGICSAQVSTDLADGSANWWVRAWTDVSGPWSPATQLFVRRSPGAWSVALPAAVRFQPVFDGTAILDRETGLVWQRTPSTSAASQLSATCFNANTGGRRGWRMPTYHEIASLAVDGQTPPLPSDHPFTLGASPAFWSQTPYGTSNYLVAHFTSSALFVTQQAPTDSYRMWCVRAATGADR